MSTREPRDPIVDGVEVRWRAVISVDESDRALLDSIEVERESAYVRQVDRDRFALGVATSRRLVGELLGVRPVDVVIDRTCVDCGRPHGRPRVREADLDFSLSHAGDWVVVASTRPGSGGRRVGVDVEEAGIDGTELSSGVLTLAEQSRFDAGESFARLWVAKEAAVKATGEGLRRRLDSVEIGTDDTLVWTGDGERPLVSRLHRLHAPPGHVAALVVLD